MDIDVLASGSSGNCIRVSDGHTAVLLEAGIPISQIRKRLKYRLSDISGVLISHEHKDHSKAAEKLAHVGINVYMSLGTARVLELNGPRIHAVPFGRTFAIGSLRVFPFLTQHDAVEPFGYIIVSKETEERLLFFTDTFYLSYIFEPPDYIVGEVNYSKEILQRKLDAGELDRGQYNRIYRSHMSLETFEDFLRSQDISRLKQINVIHMSDRNSDETLFKERIQKITGCPVYIA